VGDNLLFHATILMGWNLKQICTNSSVLTYNLIGKHLYFIEEKKSFFITDNFGNSVFVAIVIVSEKKLRSMIRFKSGKHRNDP
jgi:hypothetical protein